MKPWPHVVLTLNFLLIVFIFDMHSRRMAKIEGMLASHVQDMNDYMRTNNEIVNTIVEHVYVVADAEGKIDDPKNRKLFEK